MRTAPFRRKNTILAVLLQLVPLVMPLLWGFGYLYLKRKSRFIVAFIVGLIATIAGVVICSVIWLFAIFAYANNLALTSDERSQQLDHFGIALLCVAYGLIVIATAVLTIDAFLIARRYNAAVDRGEDPRTQPARVYFPPQAPKRLP